MNIATIPDMIENHDTTTIIQSNIRVRRSFLLFTIIIRPNRNVLQFSLQIALVPAYIYAFSSDSEEYT